MAFLRYRGRKKIAWLYDAHKVEGKWKQVGYSLHTTDAHLAKWHLKTYNDKKKAAGHTLPPIDRTLKSVQEDYVGAAGYLHKHAKPKTAHGERPRVMALFRAYPDTRIAQISCDDIEHILPDYQTSEPATYNNYLKAIRNFFKWAISKQYATINPARAHFTYRKIPKKRPIYLAKREREKLFNITKQLPGPKLGRYPQIYYMALLAYLHGMRKAEVVLYKWEYFDWARNNGQGAVFILDQKIGDRTAAPMHGRVRKAFYPLRQLSGYVFVDAHGKPYSENTKAYPGRMMRKALELAGLYVPRRGFHIGRKTVTSHLLSKGVSVWLVAKWTGNSVKTIEDHYGDLVPGANKDINKS